MTPSTVGILGLGVSGMAAAEALLQRGVAVTVVDSGDGEAVRARATTLRERGADVRLGDTAAVGDVDVVVPSPGVPEAAPLLSDALDRGVPVWSEPELAWRLAEGRTRLIGVTGTNGKTTTTEMIAACLDIPAAGNIGLPLVALLSRPQPPPFVVAELSSFQLRFIDDLRPDVAVLLNVAPDHLDWHGTMDAYARAKARLWHRQRPSDITVSNDDDPGAAQVVADHPPPGRRVGFTHGPPSDGQVGVAAGTIVARTTGATVDVVETAQLGVAGPHNVANACAAVAACLAAGAAAESLAGPLSSFRPGAHRLQRVAVVDDVAYVDDSKATNPHAAAAALATFGGIEPTVVWIAGGLGKGLEFTALTPAVAATVRTAVTIGQSGPVIAAMVRDLGIPVVEAGTLADAVPAAARLARPGDTVLLAPACASMDQFRDYAERGDAFAAAVATLDRKAVRGR